MSPESIIHLSQWRRSSLLASKRGEVTGMISIRNGLWLSIFTCVVVSCSGQTAEGRPLRIMCAGDSITAGYTDNPKWTHPFEFGYRGELFKLLKESGVDVQYVGESPEPFNKKNCDPTLGGTVKPKFDLRDFGQDKHRGYGGWNITSLQQRIAKWIEADRPEVILLMIGINGISPQSPSQLERLVETIFAANKEVTLVVAQITPRASFNEDILAYNTFIRETLVPERKKRGFRIATVNQYRYFLTDPGNPRSIDPKRLSNRINHPDNVMYGQMARGWFEAIQSLGFVPKAWEQALGKSTNGVSREVKGNIAATVGLEPLPASLTPPPPAAPRINGPSLFGVRPGSPCLYLIPATGERPMTFSVEGLPEGLNLEPARGRITGRLEKAGKYQVVLIARNAKGEVRRPFQIIAGDSICLTPPMGWNSWNCWAAAVDQEKVLRAAKALVATGLDQHGWSFINIDDAWQGKRGGKHNAIQPNAKFPDIKALADEIHGLGLKFGIYSTPWRGSYAGWAGSSCDRADGIYDWMERGEHNEFLRLDVKDLKQTGTRRKANWVHGTVPFFTQDANQWAEWGVDFLKYDWRPIDLPHAEAMRKALRATGRDIVYSLSNAAAFTNAAVWGELANLWRTTGDIVDKWKSISGIGFGQDRWAPFQTPGHYNDPDMLVLGKLGWGKPRPNRLTPDEQYTHISLWCLLSAPLLLGCDLEKLDPFTLGLLANDEVLAIDQDPLAKSVRCIKSSDTTKIYIKELVDGTKAIGLFNLGVTPASVTLLWGEAGLKSPQLLRDLWRQKDVGTFDGSYTVEVPAHGVTLLKVSLPGGARHETNTAKPNIVYLLADQWRASATGYAGDPNVRTPNLDRLAKEGLNFQNAVSVCPVCTPYRAALMTGRYPTSTGIFLNDRHLPDKEVCIAEVLKSAGYATAYIGKWHLDGLGRTAYIPPERRQGWDYWKAAECDHNYNHSHYYTGNSDVKLFWDGYDAFAQTRDAQQYIRDQASSKRPFVLMVSYGPPHFPVEQAPKEFMELYPLDKIQLPPNVPSQMQRKARKFAQGYYASCTAIDQCVGDVLKTLEEVGLSSNTIVVFTADHGEMLGSHGGEPMKKLYPWSEASNVPFILRYPVIHGNLGRVVRTPLTTPDIFPTLAGLIGVKIPDSIQGDDLSLLLRERREEDRAALYMVVAPFGGLKPGEEYRAIRTDRYTYVRGLNGPSDLYDDVKDPGQMENLVAKPEFAALVAKLDGHLQTRLKKIGDAFKPAEVYLEKWGYRPHRNAGANKRIQTLTTKAE